MKTLVTFLATVLFNKSLKKDIMPILLNPSKENNISFCQPWLKKNELHSYKTAT